MKIIRYSQSQDINKEWYTKEVAENPNTPPEILTEILRKGNNDFVSENIASNPNTPPEILVEVLKRGNDDLVSYYAAKNPNTPPEILTEVLRRGNDDYVSFHAFNNPNTPPEAKIQWMRNTGKIGKEDPNKHIIEYDNNKEVVDEDLEKLKQLISCNFNLKRYSQDINRQWYNLEVAEDSNTSPEILAKILKEGNSDEVSWRAVQNPNTPPEILTEILKRENNDIVSQTIVDSPNTPSDILEEVLKRGRDDTLSMLAAGNPNTPPKIKIQWMRDTGKIGKEDPNKHIIEYDSKEVIDEDLEKLKQLVSNNFNLKKYSQVNQINQNEDWYSIDAVENSNSSPEILTRILRENNNDNVSYYAARNPNTPPEMLAEVLKIGNDDKISRTVASNPNTPPEMLVEVLNRGKNNIISFHAFNNPNTPPEAKIQWMRDTGQIGKEDPSKHIIEYDNKEEVIDKVDEDLEKLKQLVSNNFNLKKYSQIKNKDREYPIAAVVLAAGKVFKGRSHFEALQKAIKAGYVITSKDGYFVDTDGVDMTYSGATDMFLTNKGRIIDRIESMNLGEAVASEDIPEEEREKVANNSNNMFRTIKAEKVEAYHGTPTSFSKFDISKGGEGTDQEGPGLYFSNDKDDASGYMEGGKLFHVYLNFNKTVPLQGEVNIEEIKKLILWSMGLENEEQLENMDMDKFYESSASNWGEDPYSAFIEALNSLLEYAKGPHDAFQQVWFDFYRYNPTSYLNNMVKLGYDGVIIPKEEGRAHYVVFNSNIIDIIEIT